MPTDTATKLDELLDALAEYAGDNKDKQREVAIKLLDKDETKPIGEVLLKKGLGKRTGAEAEKVTELQGRVTELEGTNREQAQTIRDLEAKQPDVQRQLENNDRKWQAKLDAEKKKAEEAINGRASDRIEIEKQKFFGALGFGRPGGVDEEWGKDVLPIRYADRFVPGPDGTVTVLEPGETTAYDPADGPPAEQLARDVLAKVPPKYRLMGALETGGGVSGDGGRLDKGTAAAIDQKARTENYVL